MSKILIFLLILPNIAFGQKDYKTSIALDEAEKINMSFKWPEIITIKYHDQKDIIIEGTVSINYGQYDNDFDIKFSRSDKILYVVGEVRNIDSMERITVIKSNNRLDKSKNSNVIITDRDEEYVSKGVMINIFLTIYLPRLVPVSIESKFGLIEIKEIDGPLIADSKFGGVDLTIDQKENFDLKAGTVFGEIFTNLQVDFRGNGELQKNGKWHRIASTFGHGGLSVEVESKFGDLYLRRFE